MDNSYDRKKYNAQLHENVSTHKITSEPERLLSCPGIECIV